MSITKAERGQYDYKVDKVLGDKGENMFINFLKSNGFTDIKKNPQQGIANLKLWDIEAWYDGKRYTYEIKTDARAADTGNLCIEHSRFNLQNEKILSGVSVTTADFFVSIIPDLGEIRIIYTSVLKDIIEKEEGNLMSVKMGDGLRSRGYLMRINKYEKHYRAVHRI